MLDMFIIAYPWDLIDEGVDSVLDRLHGAVGADGVSVWAAVPPVLQLRVRPLEPRLIRSRGGLVFQPRAEYFSQSRIKPASSHLETEAGLLQVIREGCVSRGLKFRVRVSAAGTGVLALLHPEFACRNVFGYESTRYICLSNPDVRGYLRGLVKNLAADFSPEGIVIADCAQQWFECTAVESSVLGPADSQARQLLSVCFCESCGNVAAERGVNVSAARSCLRAGLELILKGSRDAEAQRPAAADEKPELAEYHSAQAEAAASLLRELRAAYDGDLVLDRGPASSALRKRTELDAGIPSAVISRIASVADARSMFAAGARRNELRVPASLATGAQAQELVSMLASPAAARFSGVEFDHYGELSDAALEWVKRAIRFAKRTASV